MLRGRWLGIVGAMGLGSILVFFLVWPVAVIVTKAVWVDGGPSLKYLQFVLQNDVYTEAITNSIWIGVATTLLTTVLVLPLAILHARWSFRGKGLLSGLLLVPMIMPPFVGAIGMQRFFARWGSVNLALMELGILQEPIDWFSGSHAFWGVVFLEVLHLYPIMFLNIAAALANIDPSLEEMASTLGVPRWRRYKDILWPLARPGYFAGAIIVFIWALTDLGTPLLVGYDRVLPVSIFTTIKDIHENPVGYALVFVIILLSVAVFLLSQHLTQGKKYEMLGRGHVASSAAAVGPLGTFLVWLVHAVVIGAALLPHASVLVTALSDQWFMTILPQKWTIKYFEQLSINPLAMTGIKNSLMLSAAATGVNIVLGLALAHTIVRRTLPFTRVLDALIMVPLALPGVVLAFGYVVTYSGTFLDPMINPVPLLVIAYAIRRLPYLVRSAAAGLQQTSLSLEEASTVMGASRIQTLRFVTLPLVMANLIAGALLCFAYSMLDVSDSLILAMKDAYYPLTKAIYTLFLEQGSGEFVASALGIVGMLILTLCILGASVILGKKMGELFKS